MGSGNVDSTASRTLMGYPETQYLLYTFLHFAALLHHYLHNWSCDKCRRILLPSPRPTPSPSHPAASHSGFYHPHHCHCLRLHLIHTACACACVPTLKRNGNNCASVPPPHPLPLTSPSLLLLCLLSEFANRQLMRRPFNGIEWRGRICL